MALSISAISLKSQNNTWLNYTYEYMGFSNIAVVCLRFFLRSIYMYIFSKILLISVKNENELTRTMSTS